MSGRTMEPKDLLLADLEHFGASMLHNEQVGEKRFEFFVTLTTAVIAGLVALAAGGTNSAEYLEPTSEAAVAGLLAFGILTYLRMLHRNRVTDEYKSTLKYIRRLYRQACPELASEEYSVPRRAAAKGEQWLKAGYAETVGAIDGALVGGFAYLLFTPSRPDSPLWTPAAVSTGIGVAVAGALWLIACRRDDARERPAAYFRAGVGAVVVNQQGRALVLERSDRRGAWQFPQGGLKKGNEDPAEAVMRELREETGLTDRDVRLIAKYPEPLVYVLPDSLRNPKTGLGQVQWWFVFVARNENVRVTTGKESVASDWRHLDDVIAGATPFREGVYRRLRGFVAAHTGAQNT